MALNSTTPQNLPAEFHDTLSSTFLLQPDLEFIFARWAYGAAAQAGMLDEDGFDVVLMQLREGRFPVQGDIANLAQATQMGAGGPLMISGALTFPDLVKMVVEARRPGEVIKMNRPRFIDGAASESGRRLAPSTRVFGTNSQPLLMEQVDVTVREYGGPGDANGAIVPINVADFASARSLHNLAALVGVELKRDRNKFIDVVIRDLLIAAAAANSDGVTYGGGVAAATAFTADGAESMDLTTLLRARTAMTGRKVPGVLGGKYICVIDYRAATDLKDDSAYQRQGVFHPEYNVLFPGYMKTVENLVICESNNMPTLTSSIGGATRAYQSLIMGAGCLGWASGRGARVMRDNDDDGGRINQYAWNAHEGWEVLDHRFVQKIITD